MSSALLRDFFQKISFPKDYSIPSIDDFVQCHLDAASVNSIRINPFKFHESDFTHFDIDEKILYHEFAYHLKDRPSYIKNPLWHAGAFYVQEAGSMHIGSIVNQIRKEKNTSLRVLDLCAAPGGKSTDIASFLLADDLLISNEIHPQRSEILYENCVKWGTDNVWVTNNAPEDFQFLKNYFDIIIIDAPCSGSGMWRKDKDTVNEWSEQQVNTCAQRQKDILDAILPTLKDEGVLIYSTCAYSQEENEDMLDYIAEHYSVRDYPLEFHESDALQTKSVQYHLTGYRCAPWHSLSEGFFFAALQIEKDTADASLKSKSKFKTVSLPSISIPENRCIFEQEKSMFHFIHLSHQHDFSLLTQKKLRFKKIGTRIGEFLKNQLVPNHEWALSIHQTLLEFPSIELEEEVALDYLRRETIQIETSHKSWLLVTYHGHPLGWVKALGNRVNNYYPKNWRIRYV